MVVCRYRIITRRREGFIGKYFPETLFIDFNSIFYSRKEKRKGCNDAFILQMHRLFEDSCNRRSSSKFSVAVAVCVLPCLPMFSIQERS